MTTLYLVRGLPGSGKSTFAKQLAGRTMAHLEADQFFEGPNAEYKFNPESLRKAHEWCQERSVIYIRHGYSVVVSNTSTTEKEVAVYKAIADKYRANFISMIIENRHEGVNVHNVPAEKIEQMRNRFSVKL